MDSPFTSIYQSSGLFEWKRNESFDDHYDHSRGKKKLVAALISNCNAKGNRLQYIAKLNKSIRVDLYGKCGTPCPFKIIEFDQDPCVKAIAKRYKFYLAFENSKCNGYITEKFFQTFNYDMIPVVMGAGPYDYYVGILDLSLTLIFFFHLLF